MSEVVSRFLPHSRLQVSNLSKVTRHWPQVDLKLRSSGYKAQNIIATPLHHNEKPEALFINEKSTTSPAIFHEVWRLFLLCGRTHCMEPPPRLCEECFILGDI